MRLFIVVLGISSLLLGCAPAHQVVDQEGQTDTLLSTEFKQEGQLTLFVAEQAVQTLVIEVADDTPQIMQGLMYRDHLAEDRGMLFIYPDSEPRQFWMKNTRISLDILYFDANQRLLNIAQHTEPFALTGIPASEGDAMYVLEINAGLSEKWGLLSNTDSSTSINQTGINQASINQTSINRTTTISSHPVRFEFTRQ